MKWIIKKFLDLEQNDSYTSEVRNKTALFVSKILNNTIFTCMKKKTIYNFGKIMHKNHLALLGTLPRHFLKALRRENCSTPIKLYLRCARKFIFPRPFSPRGTLDSPDLGRIRDFSNRGSYLSIGLMITTC